MSEVLTQAQIDALLNSMSGGGGDAEETVVEKKKEEQKYKKYDFFSPKKFTRDKLRLLRSIHETYARVVSSRLNSVLRTGCTVEILDVEEQRYYEFANSLHDNDVVTLVRASMHDGHIGEPILLKVDTSIMLSMIDHMLGSADDDGDGANGDFSSYTYTDIELRIYHVIANYMVGVMADGWSNYIELGFELERLETNPTMMQEISRDESVAIVILDIQLGNLEGKISICLPDTVLSTVFKIMDKKSSRDSLTEEEKEETSKIVLNHIRKTSLEMKAELGKSQLLLRDVYSLQVGDIINLNKAKDSEIYLTVADKTCFKGYLGTNNKNMAIKISGVYDNAPVSSQRGE